MMLDLQWILTSEVYKGYGSEEPRSNSRTIELKYKDIRYTMLDNSIHHVFIVTIFGFILNIILLSFLENADLLISLSISLPILIIISIITKTYISLKSLKLEEMRELLRG